ncbi:MAG: Flp family type IVb pilin [Pseudomonadota bacterium]
MNALMNFIKDEDGVTTIEYVLLAAGVAAVVVVVVGAMNPGLATRLTTVINTVVS